MSNPFSVYRSSRTELTAPSRLSFGPLQLVLEEVAPPGATDAQIDATGVHGVEKPELLDHRQCSAVPALDTARAETDVIGHRSGHGDEERRVTSRPRPGFRWCSANQ